MIPSFVQTGAVFILVLSFLVFIHELGHFLVAVLLGVKVEEFGFGLPPLAKVLRTVMVRGNKVALTLNWLPIGGFVRLAGEDELTESIDEAKKKYKGKNIKQFFWARAKWERAAILLAGVTMNFLLAVGITTYLITQGLEEPAPRVKVEGILPNTPAEFAGLRSGDRITSIEVHKKDGTTEQIPTRLPEELVNGTKSHQGEEIVVVVLREKEELRLPITPRKDFPQGEGPMGIKIGFDVQTIKYPWYQAPFYAFKLTIQRAKDMAVGLASLPAKALSGQKVRDEVAGPIGIAQVTGEAARIGPSAVLNLMSILSLSLALLNVLPIPALDGGRLFFIVIEAIIGKPVRASWERNAHQIGMIVLLLFIVLVTLNDITRIFRG